MKYQEVLNWIKANWKNPRLAFVVGLSIPIILGLIDNYLEQKHIDDEETYMQHDFAVYKDI